MVDRNKWSREIDSVIRSRRYTWLGEGLGGAAVEDAMAVILADVMHVCKRQNIPWDALLQRAQSQFEAEESSSVAART